MDEVGRITGWVQVVNVQVPFKSLNDCRYQTAISPASAAHATTHAGLRRYHIDEDDIEQEEVEANNIKKKSNGRCERHSQHLH